MQRAYERIRTLACGPRARVIDGCRINRVGHGGQVGINTRADTTGDVFAEHLHQGLALGAEHALGVAEIQPLGAEVQSID